jgi:hypothetical protein
MSRDDTNRVKLGRLADALIDDIVNTSDVDILAEVGPSGIERARSILVEVKATTSRRLLAQAREELQAWRAAQSPARYPLDLAIARDRFEKIRSADPAFNKKMMMAARNGKDPTDRDKQGLIEDWVDLQKLDEQDTLE